MDMDLIASLMTFFSLKLETDSFPQGKSRDFFAVRLNEPARKTYFTTENGPVGIATLPIHQGDLLCLLDNAAVYFVLREAPDSKVEGQGSRSETAQKHRIVARAAVKGVDLPTLRTSAPRCRFQNCSFQIV